MSIKLNAQSGGSVALDAPTQTTGSADVTLKLPVADGSANQGIKTDGSGNLSFGAFGITEADQWAITNSSNFTGSATIFNSNWARNPNSMFGKLGTGMTESSGVFTFPSTGIYLIMGSFTFYSVSSALRYVGIRFQTSTDNMSSVVNANTAYTHIGLSNSFGAYAHVSDNIIFDVTNTSTHKIRFTGLSITSSATYVAGNSDGMGSGVTFIRLGDT
tara:strand:- start:667 stop:1314 length:648 start_codon:yes stop_codon:yes gene_type:complete